MFPSSRIQYARTLNSRLVRGLLALAAVLLFITSVLPYCHISLRGSLRASSTETATSAVSAIPRKIWQTWTHPVNQIADEELQRFTKSWTTHNPDHRYELLTDQAAATYVAATFWDRPDIVDTFQRIRQPVLRADFLRYLVMLGDGGTYTDIDTECSRPVHTWVPEEFNKSAGFVVGIEYDASVGQLELFPANISFCQWTFMARPGHPVTQHIVDRVVESLQRYTDNNGTIATPEGVLVGEVTGPGIFTEAIFEALTSWAGRSITISHVSGLTSPMLMGDVLILPVSAFGSGQSHSGSKAWGNDEQLMCHHFRMTWRDRGAGWIVQ